MYFTGDVEAKDRVRGLNEFNKINLNQIRRKNMLDDGFFNISQHSNHDVDNDVEPVDSQMNLMHYDSEDY